MRRSLLPFCAQATHIGEAHHPGPGIDDPDDYSCEGELGYEGCFDEEVDIQWEYYKAAFRMYQAPIPTLGHVPPPAESDVCPVGQLLASEPF